MNQTWTWENVNGHDVFKIVQMAIAHFQTEIDQIFKPDPLAYSRNLMHAVVAQFYNPGTELFKVAKDNETGAILAYVWAIRGQKAPWSDEEMVAIRMVHVDLSLPVRTRLALVTQMLLTWEEWAVTYAIPIICSTTMRRDTEGFLRLHAKHGYDVRGSFAYKRMSTLQTGLPIP